jgi:hypothetical protein
MSEAAWVFWRVLRLDSERGWDPRRTAAWVPRVRARGGVRRSFAGGPFAWCERRSRRQVSVMGCSPGWPASWGWRPRPSGTGELGRGRWRSPAGLSSDDRRRIAELEKGNWELRRADEILKRLCTPGATVCRSNGALSTVVTLPVSLGSHVWADVLPVVSVTVKDSPDVASLEAELLPSVPPGCTRPQAPRLWPCRPPPGWNRRTPRAGPTPTNLLTLDVQPRVAYRVANVLPSVAHRASRSQRWPTAGSSEKS